MTVLPEDKLNVEIANEETGEPKSQPRLDVDYISQPDASSSRHCIDNSISPAAQRSHAIRIVEDNFYKSKQTGIRTSIFHEEFNRLRQVATLHGLALTDDISHETARQMLIHHIIHGHCCKDLARSDGARRPACTEISAGFQGIRDLSDCILDSFLLYLDDMSKLPPRKLIAIADAIDFRDASLPVDPHRNSRRDSKVKIKAFRKTRRLDEWRIREMFSSDFEDMSRVDAASVAKAHGLCIHARLKKDDIKELIIDHLVQGRCLQKVVVSDEDVIRSPDATLCASAVREFLAQSVVTTEPDNFKLYAISAGIERLSLNAARRLARMLDISYDTGESKSGLKKRISSWLRESLKGKTVVSAHPHNVEDFYAMANRRKLWPQVIGDQLKDKIRSLFKEITSSAALTSLTCASCGTSTSKKKAKQCAIADIDLSLLKRPDLFEEDFEQPEDNWLDPEIAPPPMPYDHGPLKDVLVDPAGVAVGPEGTIRLVMCNTCSTSVKNKRVPPLALSNRMYIGPIPPELQDLTVVEEAMVARCRAQCWVVQLKEESQDIVVPTSQRGMKGHIIIYPQNPSAVAESLPPAVEEITSPLCVLFVGAMKPTDEWLRDKAKPLAVRGDKVRNALKWLKTHNRYYKDIRINKSVLRQLEQNPILPFHIEHVVPSSRVDEVTARYDNSAQDVDNECNEHSIPFENVVISDVNGDATVNQLRAAAFRHVKRQGKGYIQIARGSQPVNEFDNPSMLPMCYPTLFPYGLGGTEDPHRGEAVTMKRHVKHLFSTRDQRFQQRYSFMFIVFNILQRREALLRTSLKTRKDNFAAFAEQFATLSPETIHLMSERVSRGDYTAKSQEERNVLKLMREVNAVTSYVPGSPTSKVAMRNEIKALIVDQGLPHFYITINPADVYNPIVKFLAGSDIDVDHCLPSDHNYYDQAFLVAKNPANAAKFFNIYMKAFIYAVLGYQDNGSSQDGGILGRVKAYYGTVEAQGRGTLHCHMMIWIEGALNPDEIKKRINEDQDEAFKDRLIAFLDDTISTEFPLDPDPNLQPYHPCAVRGPLAEDDVSDKKDKHLLVLRCQYHTHSKTCYKYDPNQCRFDLGEGKQLRPITTVNPDTGEIELCCLHVLVNNFNETILAAVRCNMDIKYIGSGASAKAVVFYITDYITKSQLQAHVAYAALELAYKKLGEVDSCEDDISLRAKRLLQKCVYAMISHQEMSAQQVASYLMDFEDHFTSHKYVSVFWTSFERFVNENDPSPECYPTAPASTDSPEVENTASQTAIGQQDTVDNAAPIDSQMFHDERLLYILTLMAH